MFLFIYDVIENDIGHEEFEIFDACDIDEALKMLYQGYARDEAVDEDLFFCIISKLGITDSVDLFNALTTDRIYLHGVYSGLTQLLQNNKEE